MFTTRSSHTADRTIVDDHGEDVDAVTSVIGGVLTEQVAVTRAILG